MLLYYLGLLRDIPRAFRGAVETWVFWGGVVVLIGLTALQFFSVALAAKVQAVLGAAPHWYGLAGLALLLIYALARANWRQIQIRDAKLAMYVHRQRETYLLLNALALQAQELRFRDVPDDTALRAWFEDVGVFESRLHGELKEALKHKETWWLRIVERMQITNDPLGESGITTAHRQKKFELFHRYESLLGLAHTEFQAPNPHFAP